MAVNFSFRKLIGVLILIAIVAFVGGKSIWSLYVTHQDYTISFPRSTIITEETEIIIADIANVLKSEDGLKVQLTGHTSPKGDKEANMKLSIKRSEAIREELAYLGIKEDRVIIKGEGGTKPLSKNSAESEREYNSRNSRVDVRIGRFIR